MRKITSQSVNAFVQNRSFSSSNTVVSVNEQTTALILHGHVIAMKNRANGVVSISNKGYTTNTTKERLNGLIEELCGYENKIYQRNYEWYWDIDGVKTEFPCGEFTVLPCFLNGDIPAPSKW